MTKKQYCGIVYMWGFIRIVMTLANKAKEVIFMEKIRNIKTKVIVVLTILIIVFIMSANSYATKIYTSELKKEDKLTFKGNSWSVFESKELAQKVGNGEHPTAKRYMRNGEKLTILAIDQNVLKIAKNEYIYYGSTAAKYFTKVEGNKENKDTGNKNTASKNTGNKNTASKNTASKNTGSKNTGNKNQEQKANCNHPKEAQESIKPISVPGSRTHINRTRCKVCKTVICDLKPTEHIYGKWTTTKNATCCEEGEKKRTCICGNIETKKIKATGKHKNTYKDYRNWDKDDVTNEYHTIYLYCKESGKMIKKLKTQKHKYDDLTVTKKPTCNSKGEAIGKCKCGFSEKVVTLNPQHDWGSAHYKCTTYSTTGHYVSARRCNNCGICEKCRRKH